MNKDEWDNMSLLDDTAAEKGLVRLTWLYKPAIQNWKFRCESHHAACGRLLYNYIETDESLRARYRSMVQKGGDCCESCGAIKIFDRRK